MEAEAREFLRRRLGAEPDAAALTAGSVASNIAFGAAVLGAQHVELKDQDGWWFVASEFDWMSATATPLIDLFSRIVAFPEQGPSSHRSEVYVGAFADDAYVASVLEVVWIHGTPREPLPHIGVVPPWCGFVLAFRWEAQA